MLWLRHLDTGEIPGFAELGREVGAAAGGAALTGQAISGWSKRDEAPDSYRNNLALASVLGVEAAWLIDGEGAAPRPALWLEWTDARGVGRNVRGSKGAKTQAMYYDKDGQLTPLLGVSDATPFVVPVPDQRGRKKKRAK